MKEVGPKNEFLATNESPIFKKTMKKIPHFLLLPLSIFSFLFSSYSSSFPIIHSPNNYFHHYFSPNSIHPYFTPPPFLTKSVLFLICNVLLVFFAKTSADLVLHPRGATYPNELHDALQRKIDFIRLGLVQTGKWEIIPFEELDSDEYLLEDKGVCELEDNEQEEEKAEVVSEEPREDFIVDIAESEEEIDSDDSRRCWIFDHYQGIDHEEINYEDEELNKRRIEAFIQRMKDEIIHNEQEETPST